MAKIATPLPAHEGSTPEVSPLTVKTSPFASSQTTIESPTSPAASVPANRQVGGGHVGGVGAGQPSVAGELVGVAVGEMVGAPVGATVGAVVGVPLGAAVGEPVGVAVGSTVGEPVGCALGELVGAPLGVTVGAAVGALV